MSFHSQWQSGQLLSRATTDLSAIRRFFGFGMLFLVVNIRRSWSSRIVLLTCTGRSVWSSPHVRADRVALDALREGLRRRLAPRPGPAGRPRHPGRGGRGRHPGDQVVRPQRPTSPSSTTWQRPTLLDDQRGQGPAVGAVLDLPRDDPQPRRRRRAAARRDRRRPRRADARRARRVHHPDALAGVAGRLARRDPGDGPGGHDRGRAGARDLRHPARHRLRRRPRRPRAARPPALRARRLHLPRRVRHSRSCATSTSTCAPGRDARARRRDRLRQDRR